MFTVKWLSVFGEQIFITAQEIVVQPGSVSARIFTPGKEPLVVDGGRIIIVNSAGAVVDTVDIIPVAEPENVVEEPPIE